MTTNLINNRTTKTRAIAFQPKTLKLNPKSDKKIEKRNRMDRTKTPPKTSRQGSEMSAKDIKKFTPHQWKETMNQI